MRAKTDIKSELESIKRTLAELKAQETEIKDIASSKGTAEGTSSQLLELFRLVMNNNMTTQALIRHMDAVLAKMATQFDNAEFEDQTQGDTTGQEFDLPKEIPLSDLDKKVLQYIQTKGMACAGDIQKAMNYKGKNGACARLKRLQMLGLIERYQLGHKVFYKYDAGKTARSTLIVSPPQ